MEVYPKLLLAFEISLQIYNTNLQHHPISKIQTSFLVLETSPLLTSSLPLSTSSLPPWLPPTTSTSFYQDFTQSSFLLHQHPRPPLRATRIGLSACCFLSLSNPVIVMALPVPKMVPSTTTAQCLKAAIFHTMAFKLSLTTNNNKITTITTRSFLQGLYNVCNITKKNINFEQYNRPT